ncbi:MAG: hypothetical protein CMC15_18690 [Flavobacteriaceae bacterium]|nr:hypothetical protein [Flavobacteriaceae bacterium]|tara:strand:- start:392 stop:577 length:186 start_codon:yes stop_codon:yes gene_type:complete
MTDAEENEILKNAIKQADMGLSGYEGFGITYAMEGALICEPSSEKVSQKNIDHVKKILGET